MFIEHLFREGIALASRHAVMNKQSETSVLKKLALWSGKTDNK